MTYSIFAHEKLHFFSKKAPFAAAGFEPGTLSMPGRFSNQYTMATYIANDDIIANIKFDKNFFKALQTTAKFCKTTSDIN